MNDKYDRYIRKFASRDEAERYAVSMRKRSSDVFRVLEHRLGVFIVEQDLPKLHSER